ncbi:unnamed protein product [Brassicogethes aeneus]|uniref:Phorbol-ester/DAG-type domain-containing protein n=1 Tax=Brassicogethes aeneus TaxID=1431903 RepID=A0A9P0AS21_BRAAE|nr:unnamed protein product [Brassicogethes aeneus]
MTKKKTAKKKSLTCAICEKSLGKTKIKLQCQNCTKWAHQECTGVLKNWSCAECKEEESSFEDDTDIESEAEDNSGSQSEVNTKKECPKPKKKYTLGDIMKQLEKIETKHDELLNKFQEIL